MLTDLMGAQRAAAPCGKKGPQQHKLLQKHCLESQASLTKEFWTSWLVIALVLPTLPCPLEGFHSCCMDEEKRENR